MAAIDLILERFSSLSPSLQTAARFVVDHPNEVVTVSMRALAERAQTLPATLVRLSQQLGYAGWPELKAAFVEELGLQSGQYGQRAQSVVSRGRVADLQGEMFAAQRGNLAATEAQCGKSLRDAAKLLKRARTVHVAAFRASAPVASAFVYGYRLFRDSVHLVDGRAGGLEMQLRPIERRDAVVAISFAPYSREVLEVLDSARSAGASVVALTDSSASPLAFAADVSVLFAAASPSFFPSITAAVAVTEALLELLVADAGEGAVQQIELAEQHLMHSGAYVGTTDRKRSARR